MADKLFKTVKFSLEDEYRKEIKEITFKTQYIDEPSFDKLLGLFREFVVAIGYNPETALLIQKVQEGELESLGLTMEDLSFHEIY